MKIAQISDTHISADGRLVDGVDGRDSLTWALREAVRTQCDLVVLSGDLAATKNDWGAYPWIAEQVSALPIPTHVMSGNHDGTPEVVRAFGLANDYTGGSLRSSSVHDDVAVYCLDSSSERLPEEQLEWLREEHARRSGTTPLVFLHHPPLPCGCRFMDSHEPLENRDHVWQRLIELQAFKHVFCGHYHTHKVVERDGIRVVLCPSTLLQIPQDSVGFAIEHKRPGYLEISVLDGEVSWRAVYRDH
jgi:Icc protein